jgi:Ca2+-transporting ATPase
VFNPGHINASNEPRAVQFNARRATGSGFRGAGSNPYLWMALGLTVALEAAALGIPPLRDLLELTTLPATAWLVGLGLGIVPLVTTQAWRGVRARA